MNVSRRVNIFDDPVLMAFLGKIASVKGRIQKIFLFGSRARGHELPDSDYDILIVVDRKDRSLRGALYDAVVDIEIEMQKQISPKIFTSEEFQRLSGIPTPFMKNVLSE